MPQVRYQIFISSTYEDLRQERQQATQAVLEAGSFPAGMKLFPASDDTQWELIKRVIEESDYYVVIVAGRYGSVGPEGLSYTEMEYDYAVETGLPVLGFVRGDLAEVPFGNTEQSDEGKKKLASFRQKVLSRTCRKYTTPADLGMAVLKSLMTEARIRPGVGWVRADQARSEADVQRERDLNAELEEAQRQIKNLDRQLRDRSLLGDEIARDSLAQGDDQYNLTIAYSGKDKRLVCEDLPLTWEEIFRVIGPTMYGYILRKASKYNEKPAYPFQDDLEEYIRSKIFDKIGNRKMNIKSTQIDQIVIR